MFSSIHSCRRRGLAAWGVSSDLHGSDAGHQGCSQRWDRGSAIIVGWRDQCGLSVKLTSYDSDAGKKHVICWFVLCFLHWSLRGFTMAVKRPRGSAQVRVPIGEQEIADRRTLAQWISEPRFLKTCRYPMKPRNHSMATWHHDTIMLHPLLVEGSSELWSLVAGGSSNPSRAESQLWRSGQALAPQQRSLKWT